MHTVAVERAENYQPSVVAEAMGRALVSLGGMGAFVHPGERVLIKPNMLAAKAPDRAVTTHPEVLRAVIGLILQAGGVPMVGDSPGIGGFRAVAEKSGMAAVARETGAELVSFDDTLTVQGSGLFRRIEVARPYLEADRLINLPKLKTHEMMTLTCAVKNLFGAVVGAAKAGWHLKAGADRELFARLLLEIYLLRPPDLTIVDGIVAMEGDGPGSGDPRPAGLILAGSNAVAVDVVAAELTGIPKKLLWVERAAERLDIEGWDRTCITTVGLSLDAARVPDFRLPHLSDVQFGLPRFLKNRLRHHLTARPVPSPEGCRFCGACRDACPPQAISLREGRLHFDYHACIRCFCCRELCPDGSLSVRDGALLKLFKKFKE